MLDIFFSFDESRYCRYSVNVITACVSAFSGSLRDTVVMLCDTMSIEKQHGIGSVSRDTRVVEFYRFWSRHSNNTDIFSINRLIKSNNNKTELAGFRLIRRLDWLYKIRLVFYLAYAAIMNFPSILYIYGSYHHGSYAGLLCSTIEIRFWLNLDSMGWFGSSY